MSARTSLLAVFIFAGFPILLAAQIVVPETPGRDRKLPPPGRPIRPLPRPVFSSYKIRSVDVQASVHDQVAKVRMAQVFQNTGSTTVEAQFLFPIPEDAAVSELTLLYDGKELAGRLLDKDKARRIYEEIVRRQRDPALLEYVGHGLFQTSVFPIPPHADRRVEIRYTQMLKKNAGLIDFLLPLGTFKHTEHPIETFTVNLRLETTESIKTVYSPTHSIAFERPDDRHATGKLSLSNVSAPDDMRFLYSTQAGPVGMSLISFRPREKEDGFFMLLASPELKAPSGAAVAKTTLIVVDRSGSMSGEKIQQAREAVKFFLHQLKPADTFNVIAYDSEVEAFRPELQRANADSINAALSFADGIQAGGGTNIDGALKTALGLLHDDKRPSYVLFLTDGNPTVGEQDEQRIVAGAKQADKVHARIFNLGIGYDVNSRLLDRLSRELAGQSFYVRPNENIETYVSALAKSIGSPLLTNVDVKFEFDSPTAAGSAEPISRTYPRKLTDLFAGEQLVWVGRYRKSGSVKVALTGQLAGKRETFTLVGNLADRSVGDTNGFVEKVWAARRIGELIDEIDLHGQNRELVDELVELSKKHGIMTPYTSFLADEHVDLADRGGANIRATSALPLLGASEGKSAFGQRMLKSQLKGANQAPMSGGMGGMGGGEKTSPTANSFSPSFCLNGYAEDADKPAARPPIQTIGEKTFYWKENRWRDADVTAENEKHPVRIKQFSDAYFRLAAQDNGKFAKYLSLDGPVLVTLDGKTYLIELANK
jgi:Ca-activated chloride channel homolog